jgi:hypothetical protein
VAYSSTASSDGLVHFGWCTDEHLKGKSWIPCRLYNYWQPARRVTNGENVTCLRCLSEKERYRPENFSPVVLDL